MSPAHLHLLLNHLPVVGTIGAVLLLAYALLRRSPELTRVSLGLFVLVALAGVAVYLTGEPAEEAVEHLSGVSESMIESHEDAALLATILLGVVGTVALAGLVAFRRRTGGIPRGFATLALLLALAPAAAMGYTANLGGQIRHTEIRAGAAAAGAATDEAASQVAAGAHDSEKDEVR
jgi:uncharacterized membrane protein